MQGLSQDSASLFIPALGNDIVSKREMKPHPRFALRVLSALEFDCYRQHAEAQNFLLRAWAAKEACYKYLRQHRPRLTFTPARLIFDEKTQTLQGEGERIAVYFTETDEYVYCATGSPQNFAVHGMASAGASLTLASDFSANHPKLSVQSCAVRLLAQQMVGRSCALPADKIVIEKDSWGVPYASFGERRLPVRLSLTHDGDFVAVALLLFEPRLT